MSYDVKKEASATPTDTSVCVVLLSLGDHDRAVVRTCRFDGEHPLVLGRGENITHCAMEVWDHTYLQLDDQLGSLCDQQLLLLPTLFQATVTAVQLSRQLGQCQAHGLNIDS